MSFQRTGESGPVSLQREICPPETEAHFVACARRIAASLELGVADAGGIMLGVGERFRRQREAAMP